MRMDETRVRDRKDRRILALMQTNNRLTAEQIGEVVALSSTAVTRRIQRLRDGGFIVADVAVLSTKVLDPSVTTLVLCTLSPDGPLAAEKFGEALRVRGEVINAWYVAGSPDIVFEVITRTIEGYTRFAAELLVEFPNLANIQAWVVLERLKRGLALPLDP